MIRERRLRGPSGPVGNVPGRRSVPNRRLRPYRGALPRPAGVLALAGVVAFLQACTRDVVAPTTHESDTFEALIAQSKTICTKPNGTLDEDSVCTLEGIEVEVCQNGAKADDCECPSWQEEKDGRCVDLGDEDDGGDGGEGNGGTNGNDEDGEGGGGGEDGGGEEDEDGNVEFAMECNPPSVTRGGVVTCSVVATSPVVIDGVELPLDSLHYEWYDDEHVIRSSTGDTARVWRGEAVATLELSGKVKHRSLGEVSVKPATVTVLPRRWLLDPSAAGVSYTLASPSEYGQYRHSLARPRTSRGSGPWAWYYWVEHPPALSSEILMSHDFKAGGPRHPIDPEDFGDLCASPPAADNAGVYRTNQACGTEKGLGKHEKFVLEHERRHEESLNECIVQLTAGGWLDQFEALTERGADKKLKETLDELWEDFKGWVAGAAKTDLKDESSGEEIWDYWWDKGPWRLFTPTAADHHGTWGCPEAR